MSRTPCSVARRFFDEVWIKGDMASIDRFIAEDYIEHQKVPGMTPDREGLRRTIAGIRAALPGLQFTIEDAIAEDDRVALRWRMIGTHSGSSPGIPATGRTIELTGIRYFRVAGEMIVEGWNEFDRSLLVDLMRSAPDPDSALVRGCYDAFLRGDIASIVAAMDDEVVWINPVVRPVTGIDTYRGKDGVLAFFQALGGNTQLRRFEVRSVQSDADGVLATGLWQARVNATGKVASSEWLMRWKIRDGRVVFYQSILDMAAIEAAFAV